MSPCHESQRGLIVTGVRRVYRVLTMVLVVGLAGCTTTMDKQREAATVARRLPPPVPPPAIFAVNPTEGAAGVPVSAEIGATVTNGKLTDVVLQDATGKRVAGVLRDDATSWVPGAALDFGTAYTATITAAGEHATTTRHVAFTTMAKPGGQQLNTDLQLVNGTTYGVAMPIVVDFGADVPVAARATVQRRVLISSEPPQAGAWRWFSARQMVLRPQSYWQPGTTITVRKAFAGLPIGGWFGDEDFTANVTIGRRLTIDVDSATKQMSVSQDNTLLRTVPVSLGKPSTPSSTGTTVIMSKAASTIFDTTAEGPGGYRVQVAHAQRLTNGGQFIHSAPWSVADQGVRNVSHGCINMSPSNAQWLFDLTLVGDPVTIRNTGSKLEPGDGWTAWDMPWPEFAA